MNNYLINALRRFMNGMKCAFRKLIAVALISFTFFIAQSQPVKSATEKKEIKPYKLLTYGRQITIKSTGIIKQVMVWTTNGYRVVEQKEINNNSFLLYIPVNQKTFFLMIGLSDGKIYTEKIGIQ